MAQTLLLLKDIEDVGNQGEVVKVKPGYARNYLLPKQFAVVADKHTLKMQEKLREERRIQAEANRKESEAVAKKVEGKTYKVSTKVDPDGHMYGSVTANDVHDMIAKEDNIELPKKAVQLKQPLKKLGIHEVQIALKEGVQTHVMIHIWAEGFVAPVTEFEENGSEEKPAEDNE